MQSLWLTVKIKNCGACIMHKEQGKWGVFIIPGMFHLLILDLEEGESEIYTTFYQKEQNMP